MEQKALDAIKDAEMILVGIGEEFSPVWVNPEAEDRGESSSSEQEKETVTDKHGASFQEECLKSRFYESIPEEHEVIAAYNRLRELIGAKPYFAVTMNTDDLIYRSSLERDLVVAPCGSMGRLQCGEHIVPAGEIRDAVLKTQDESLAVCPECGRPLQFHTVAHSGYMEEGYLPQWEKYTKWLQCTLNRRLCILELGVGFQYPQVIRFPFEKTAFFNQKAVLIRVNSKFPQLAQELAGKGISIRENPIHFLTEC
ncbi:MAG: hypothetical protein Q4C61_08365 [Lachnospiraceae bacterium]|nr:hypothetical protein [Lachnospiraceae bacterium]